MLKRGKPFRAVDGPMIMLIAFACMLVAQVAFSIALVPFMLFDSPLIEALSYVAMILFQAVYLSVYFIYTKKKGIVSTFSPRNKITVWGILAAFAMAVICFFGFIGLAYLFESGLAETGYASSGLEVSGPAGMVLIVFATVICAPICEETIFRSAFLSGVTKVRKDEIGTSFLCGICFALMHMNPSQTVYQFCLGTALAYVTIKCRNVIPAMIIHGTSNLLALLLSFTDAGLAVDAFYMKVSSNWLIALLLCVALPAVAVVLVWLICKFLKKTEEKKYPDKYKLPRKIVWIDEVTREPIYEGDEVPVITEENKVVRRGYSSLTGDIVLVDRFQLQAALMEEYMETHGEKKGALGKNSYRVAFGIYYAVTIVFWLITLVSGYFI